MVPLWTPWPLDHLATTMSCIHYKFAAKLAYDRVIFSGLNICLRDLKRQIMAREKLKAATSDLQISNAQTGAGAWGAARGLGDPPWWPRPAGAMLGSLRVAPGGPSPAGAHVVGVGSTRRDAGRG